MIADLVLLDKNPLEDMANIRTIHAVLKEGRLLDKKTRETILEDIALKMR